MSPRQQRILVTGGAGYIGSHTTWRLLEAGYDVTVLDNFYSGFRWAVPASAHLVEGDVGDARLLKDLFESQEITAVIHFAAHVEVNESLQDPLKYYGNNTVKTQQLLTACVRFGVKNFIFSSTAAVYGDSDGTPVTEDAPLRPINPYGRSKWMSEVMLQDTSALKHIILRYFNVAGARPDALLGQATPRATHLIKSAAEVATGKRPYLEIFGDDYPTEDGTCVRDYIHVDDLARAHVKAVDYLLRTRSSGVFNCGYGHGSSVRDVIEVMQRLSPKPLEVRMGARRAGDAVSLVANANKIKQQLNWKPEHDSLEFICQTALKFEQRLSELSLGKVKEGTA